MARRVSLPAADDLFRPTDTQARQSAGAAPAAGEDTAAPEGPRRPSGRVRHDEKVTVYVTADELLDLENARLTLRRAHDLAVDRGRLVREAVALVLEDLEAHGGDSALVRRLTQG
ncbi:hypothetical protein [Nocardioides sp. 1609]|uniref:hypothetical protein n=1 Tax=Nocardioides sp. 1609 TaxID=2508327 RepID=UPI00106F728D|nr:hypothetical protein [Nocardioides sp. 1609]